MRKSREVGNEEGQVKRRTKRDAAEANGMFTSERRSYCVRRPIAVAYRGS